jgi:S1-C subfamily serine protease
MDVRSMARACAVLACYSVLAAAAGGCGATAVVEPPKPVGPKVLTAQQIRMVDGPSVVQVFGREGDSWSSGTGIVIDAQKGLVVTNAHVIAGLSSVRARYGNSEVAAQIVGQAPCEDIALVRLVTKPPGLRSIKPGSSAHIVAGQPVTALGYPDSLQEASRARLTITAGTVSVDGTIRAAPSKSLPDYGALIQHQAPINPGNSGGPLVDKYGRLIGMNTLHNTGEGGEVQGQAYAIAIDHIREILPRLERGENIAYVGWDLLPASYLSEQDLVDMGYRYVPDPAGKGLIVTGVDAGSPADRRGLEVGDYFDDIDGSSVDNVADVCQILQSREGQIIKVHGIDLANDGTRWWLKMRPR